MHDIKEQQTYSFFNNSMNCFSFSFGYQNDTNNVDYMEDLLPYNSFDKLADDLDKSYTLTELLNNDNSISPDELERKINAIDFKKIESKTICLNRNDYEYLIFAVGGYYNQMLYFTGAITISSTNDLYTDTLFILFMKNATSKKDYENSIKNLKQINKLKIASDYLMIILEDTSAYNLYYAAFKLNNVFILKFANRINKLYTQLQDRYNYLHKCEYVIKNYRDCDDKMANLIYDKFIFPMITYYRVIFVKKIITEICIGDNDVLYDFIYKLFEIREKYQYYYQEIFKYDSVKIFKKTKEDLVRYHAEYLDKYIVLYVCRRKSYNIIQFIMPCIFNDDTLIKKIVRHVAKSRHDDFKMLDLTLPFIKGIYFKIFLRILCQHQKNINKIEYIYNHCDKKHINLKYAHKMAIRYKNTAIIEFLSKNL